MPVTPISGSTPTRIGQPLLDVAEGAYGVAYDKVAAELQTMAQNLATSADQAKKYQAVLDILSTWPENGLTTPSTPPSDFDLSNMLNNALNATGIVPLPSFNVTLNAAGIMPAGSALNAYDPAKDVGGLAGVRSQWQQRINQIGQGSQQQQTALQIKSDMLKYIYDQWTNMKKVFGDGFKEITRAMG